MIYSVEQIRAIEEHSMRTQNISALDLMEKAAQGLFEQLQLDFVQDSHSFHLFCGKGNNGGDGLALARILHQAGASVSVYLLASEHYSPENYSNQERLKELAIPIELLRKDSAIRLPKDAVVIDALFGIGLTRPLTAELARLVDILNRHKGTRLSVDIPSGMSADEPNSSMAPIVMADLCYTFQYPKLALLLPDNASFTGEIRILDIGLDASLVAEETVKYRYTVATEVQQIVKKLPKYGHKGTFGHVLLVGGSYGQIGSILLAARAALRTGCGLVSCYTPACGYTAQQSNLPEAMVLSDSCETHISEIPATLARYQAVGLGMGMGTREETQHAFIQFLEGFEQKDGPALLLDADALNILALHSNKQSLLPKGTILTPHPKELERIVGKWRNDFEKLELVKALCKRLGIIIVVKGAHTAIILPDGKIFFNSTGNAGMATAGSGDSLSGIISSLLAQGYNPDQAAILGVYIHGYAGDAAANLSHQKSIIASDISDQIHKAWTSLTS